MSTREWVANHLANGLCRCCNNPVAKLPDGKPSTRCERCLETAREARRRYRERKRAQGIEASTGRSYGRRDARVKSELLVRLRSEGVPVREIARLVGLSPFTVWRRLREAA